VHLMQMLLLLAVGMALERASLYLYRHTRRGKTPDVPRQAAQSSSQRHFAPPAADFINFNALRRSRSHCIMYVLNAASQQHNTFFTGDAEK